MNIFTETTKPLKVSLLVLPGSSMMSVACTLDPMRAANKIARNLIFEWETLTLDGRPVTLTCGVPFAADKTFDDAHPQDLLIIIAGFDSDIHANKNAIIRLAKIAPQYACIGGVEAGSWVLARAGLLNHQRATTHWEDLEDFAARYPDIDVIPDRFVIDGRLFTTGGASPTFDLMLHLIRSRRGVAFAMEVASAFIYDDIRVSTEAQSFVSLGRLNTLHPLVASAIRLMETRLDDPMPIVEIALKTKVSIRSLETLFQSALATSPGKYYRHLRLQLARRLLIESHLSIQEIAVRAGFTSSSAFARSVKTHFGKAPGQLRE